MVSQHVAHLMTILSSTSETSHADDRQASAEALLQEFALLWLAHSRSKGAWQRSDWAFEELCNRVLLLLAPDDAPSKPGRPITSVA